MSLLDRGGALALFPGLPMYHPVFEVFMRLKLVFGRDWEQAGGCGISHVVHMSLLDRRGRVTGLVACLSLQDRDGGGTSPIICMSCD